MVGSGRPTRPEVCKDDNYGTINSWSIIIGTDLMTQSIKLIENDTINSVKQWAIGKLFLIEIIIIVLLINI